MTQTVDVGRLARLAHRREFEGNYTDAALVRASLDELTRLRTENDQLRREQDAIREEAFEEAAKVVARGKGVYVNGHPDIVKSLFASAAAIRALKSTGKPLRSIGEAPAAEEDGP